MRVEKTAWQIQISKHFAPDPLLGLDLLSEVFSAALVLLVTRPGYEAAQQLELLIRNESLEGVTVGVGGEGVGEEPSTESHRGIIHQGGVQDLSTTVFSGDLYPAFSLAPIILMTFPLCHKKNQLWMPELVLYGIILLA